jgi:hypothetical protein
MQTEGTMKPTMTMTMIDRTASIVLCYGLQTKPDSRPLLRRFDSEPHWQSGAVKQ